MTWRLGLGIALLSALFLSFSAPVYAQDSTAIEDPINFQSPVVPSEMGQAFEPRTIASAPSTVGQEQVIAAEAQGTASSPPRPRRWSRKVWLWILGAILVVAVVCPNCAGG